VTSALKPSSASDSNRTTVRSWSILRTNEYRCGDRCTARSGTETHAIAKSTLPSPRRKLRRSTGGCVEEGGESEIHVERMGEPIEVGGSAHAQRLASAVLLPSLLPDAGRHTPQIERPHPALSTCSHYEADRDEPGGGLWLVLEPT
jgi:hypothetical protein